MIRSSSRSCSTLMASGLSPIVRASSCRANIPCVPLTSALRVSPSRLKGSTRLPRAYVRDISFNNARSSESSPISKNFSASPIFKSKCNQFTPRKAKEEDKERREGYGPPQTSPTRGPDPFMPDHPR
ncbi:secreted protein [Candidatus Magnetobacterium bavaricum]|uniref:Secreted protein n=1 Tax=Candidatus Magnetobacterium bavaricum TaxID=29290 RepID=A0A0F3H2T1_9BACT|nr:secreted protein [Candidatus Magnetobacterium bavaricum]